MYKKMKDIRKKYLFTYTEVVSAFSCVTTTPEGFKGECIKNPETQQRGEVGKAGQMTHPCTPLYFVKRG